MRTLLWRVAATTLAGTAALVAVLSLDGQIEDVTALFGAVQGGSDFQRRAADADSACGELGAERASCEFALMRLAPASRSAAELPAPLAAPLGL